MLQLHFPASEEEGFPVYPAIAYFLDKGGGGDDNDRAAFVRVFFLKFPLYTHITQKAPVHDRGHAHLGNRIHS